MKWKSLSRVRLCDPMDCSLPGSSVHGILQARILQWSVCPPLWDLPNTGIKPRSPSLQVDSLLSEQPRKLVKTYYTVSFQIFMQAADYFERIYLNLDYSWVSQDCLIPERWQRGPPDGLGLVSGSASSTELVMQMGDPNALLQKCKGRAPS